MTAKHSEVVQGRMARLAPLVDEVILAMGEICADVGFHVDQVIVEVRSIFTEKGQNASVPLSYVEWGDLVRGRLGANNFELLRISGGEASWFPPIEVKQP